MRAVCSRARRAHGASTGFFNDNNVTRQRPPGRRRFVPLRPCWVQSAGKRCFHARFKILVCLFCPRPIVHNCIFCRPVSQKAIMHIFSKQTDQRRGTTTRIITLGAYFISRGARRRMVATWRVVDHHREKKTKQREKSNSPKSSL